MIAMSQPLRVIVDGVTLDGITKGAALTILSGEHWRAVDRTLFAIEDELNAGRPCLGIAGNFYGVPCQVDLLSDVPDHRLAAISAFA